MNISKKRALSIAAALTVVAVSATACTINVGSSSSPGSSDASSSSANQHMMGDGSMMDGGMMDSSDEASASGSASSGAASMDDRMFLMMMVPHHEQAVEMSDLVLQSTRNPEVKSLAEAIKAAQGPEIAKMKGWLDEWGMPDPGTDHMMGNDGMLDAKQMAALKDATGTARDRLYIEGMIAHHEGAVKMAQDVIDDGSNPEVKALAEAIVSAQNAEIAKMKQMLTTMPQ